MDRARSAALFLAAIAFWIMSAGLPQDEPVARWVGALLFHLLAAALLLWIFNRKQPGPTSIWSPWLFLTAAGIALLGRFSSG